MPDYPNDPNPILIPAPPSSVEAERSVIGALLQDPRVLSSTSELLTPDDFYAPEHKEIYSAILGLYAKGSAVDLMTVGESLANSGLLDSVGGAAYLLACVRFVPTTANTQSYVDIVREKSALRRLIQTARDIQSRCYSQTDSADVILASAEAALSQSSIKGPNSQNKPVKLKDLWLSVFDDIEQSCASHGVIKGIPTGYYDLDRMLTGLHPGELIVVGGRPAMGKTSFGLYAAYFTSVHIKKRVLFFSLEMPRKQLAMRLLSMHSRIPMQKMRNGSLSASDWVSMSDALSNLYSDFLIIDDTPSLTPSQMRSRIKALFSANEPPDLVVVDYLGIVSSDQKAENRQNEVSAITRQLRSIAREFRIPVIALAQLSRATVSRGDKRPTLTDLRDTGSIEQEADVVIFVHREGYYDPDSDPASGLLILAKQRNGPVGEVSVCWDMETASYRNVPDTLVATYA